MKKLLHCLIILLVFANCNSETKKDSYTIDYLKSNKWCTTEDAFQRCCEFNDNEMKVIKNGQPETSLTVVFEQKNDSLIAAKSITEKTTFLFYFRMKSLDTLSFFRSSAEGVYDNKFFGKDLIRVKQTPPKKK
jgi:hypothetical protein